MSRIITVTSGKGGVGKTSLCANLGMQLAAMNYRICIFDADLGLANINIVFGLYPENTIEDVIFHNKSLSDVIVRDQHGVDIIPGSTGVEKIANLEAGQTDLLIKNLSELTDYDFIFFDTSALFNKRLKIRFCVSNPAGLLTFFFTNF